MIHRISERQVTLLDLVWNSLIERLMYRLKHVPFTFTWYSIWSTAGSNKLVRNLKSLQMLYLHVKALLKICVMNDVLSACSLSPQQLQVREGGWQAFGGAAKRRSWWRGLKEEWKERHSKVNNCNTNEDSAPCPRPETRRHSPGMGVGGYWREHFQALSHSFIELITGFVIWSWVCGFCSLVWVFCIRSVSKVIYGVITCEWKKM